jgi:hypothetical protein
VLRGADSAAMPNGVDGPLSPRTVQHLWSTISHLSLDVTSAIVPVSLVIGSQLRDLTN